MEINYQFLEDQVVNTLKQYENLPRSFNCNEIKPFLSHITNLVSRNYLRKSQGDYDFINDKDKIYYVTYVVLQKYSKNIKKFFREGCRKSINISTTNVEDDVMFLENMNNKNTKSTTKMLDVVKSIIIEQSDSEPPYGYSILPNSIPAGRFLSLMDFEKIAPLTDPPFDLEIYDDRNNLQDNIRILSQQQSVNDDEIRFHGFGNKLGEVEVVMSCGLKKTTDVNGDEIVITPNIDVITQTEVRQFVNKKFSASFEKKYCNTY